MQKQRRIDPDEPRHERDRRVYEEPRRAVTVAVNGKFSLVAIGTLGYVRSPSDKRHLLKICPLEVV